MSFDQSRMQECTWIGGGEQCVEGERVRDREMRAVAFNDETGGGGVEAKHGKEDAEEGKTSRRGDEREAGLAN
jgi:hypothetical protein